MFSFFVILQIYHFNILEVMWMKSHVSFSQLKNITFDMKKNKKSNANFMQKEHTIGRDNKF